MKFINTASVYFIFQCQWSVNVILVFQTTNKNSNKAQAAALSKALLNSLLFFKTMKEGIWECVRTVFPKCWGKCPIVTVAWKGHIIFSSSARVKKEDMKTTCTTSAANLSYSWFYPQNTPHLLLGLEEAFEVVCVQVVFMVAVGEHQQVQVSPCWHHLIKRAELLKSQSALVVISVCLLKISGGERLRLRSVRWKTPESVIRSLNYQLSICQKINK